MKRILLLAIIIIVGIVALEPFDIVMPSSTQMIGAGLLLAILVFSIGLLWQEKPKDEREEELIDKRGKYAFYVGISVGTVGLIYGALAHRVDWWLVAVVGSMLLIKLFRKM